jgi:hypothetical protein
VYHFILANLFINNLSPVIAHWCCSYLWNVKIMFLHKLNDSVTSRNSQLCFNTMESGCETWWSCDGVIWVRGLLKQETLFLCRFLHYLELHVVPVSKYWLSDALKRVVKWEKQTVCARELCIRILSRQVRRLWLGILTLVTEILFTGMWCNSV